MENGNQSTVYDRKKISQSAGGVLCIHIGQVESERNVVEESEKL